MKTKTIVFIHGMFMTPLCWEDWIGRFKNKGYRCIAPAWPGRDRPVESLRKIHPDPDLGSLKLSDVLVHLTKVIKALDEKPVLIGHSMGGLIVQLLLQSDLGAAGVAIDSAPPMGVFTTKLSFLRCNWPAINPFAPAGRPMWMSFEEFQYAFVNTLPLEEQRAAYERFVVPESRQVPLQSLTWTGKIDFKKTRRPLLLIAGSEDHFIPASLNKSNFARYRRSASTTEFKEFAGRTHFIVGQRGWEEVADYVSAWLDEKGV